MKKTVFIVICLCVAAFLFWQLRGTNSSLPDKEKKAANSTALTSNALPFTSKTSTREQATTDINLADVATRYRSGEIEKEEAMREILAGQNNQPQDFYGKIIDQDGNPVVGAEVTGSLAVRGGLDDGAKRQMFKTQSDSDGLFQFVGIHGWQLGVMVKREGYLMGQRGEGYKGPSGEKTSPRDRAILTMWKLRGAEPLVSSSIGAKIPHDGSPATFEVRTGKISPDGDLRVTLSQFPLEIRTGREKFDWKVKIEILNGGLMEESDPYPYWAPTNGYQPSFEFNMASNAVKWLPNLKKNFYIRDAQGQYGIMQFSIYPGRSPTGIEANFTLNPSGSQNLEPEIQQP